MLKELVKHYSVSTNYVILFFQLLLAVTVSIYVVLHFTNHFLIEYNIKIIENSGVYKGEIYFSSNGTYDEKKKKTVKYKKSVNQFQKVKVAVSGQKVSSLRLDPLLDAGEVEIKDFSVRYGDQVQEIQFSDVDVTNSYNVKVLYSNTDCIVLKCLGKDPHIEVGGDMSFNRFDLSSVVYVSILAILLFSAYRVLTIYLRKYSYENIFLPAILLFYSIYVILFSSPVMGKNLLYIFVIMSLASCITNSFSLRKNYIREILLFVMVYLLMSYLSTLLSTHLADINYLNSKVLLIICACFIPLGFNQIKNYNFIFFKFLLTVLLLLMACLIICLNTNVLSINNVYFFSFLMERTDWTQKNYIFWYLLLCFGTLSFYNFKNKNDIIIILLVWIISFFTIFYSYSLLARLAFLTATAVYLLLAICRFSKKSLLIFVWILTFYIIFSPIIFSLIDLAPYHHRLVSRNAFYHTSAALIKQHWLFGYGFGSTLHMQTRDFVDISKLPGVYIESFPGGHPHNLSLLFWLEFGVFGAIFLAYYIHRFLVFSVEQTYHFIKQPALFGMIIAFEIITSFSWSIWYSQVLLTFSFFGVMFVLSMNNRDFRH